MLAKPFPSPDVGITQDESVSVSLTLQLDEGQREWSQALLGDPPQGKNSLVLSSRVGGRP